MSPRGNGFAAPRGGTLAGDTILLFMSPWIIGFTVFVVYPMVSSLYFSFTHYDLLSSPIPIGLENYRFMFTKDPVFWQAIRNTVFIIAVGVPLRIVFAILTATMLTLASQGDQGLPDHLLPSGDGSAGRGGARVRLRVQSELRTREPCPQLARDEEPTHVVLLAGGVEMGARVPGTLGHRRRDDHLPRRVCSMFPASSTRPPISRARPRRRSSATSRSR